MNVLACLIFFLRERDEKIKNDNKKCTKDDN